MEENKNNKRVQGSKKMPEVKQHANSIIDTDEEDTVKSERMRFKNADEIYE